jgi:hypothetical protein
LQYSCPLLAWGVAVFQDFLALRPVRSRLLHKYCAEVLVSRTKHCP